MISPRSQLSPLSPPPFLPMPRAKLASASLRGRTSEFVPTKVFELVCLLEMGRQKFGALALAGCCLYCGTPTIIKGGIFHVCKDLGIDYTKSLVTLSNCPVAVKQLLSNKSQCNVACRCLKRRLWRSAYMYLSTLLFFKNAQTKGIFDFAFLPRKLRNSNCQSHAKSHATTFRKKA